MKQITFTAVLVLAVCLPASATVYSYDFTGINGSIPEGANSGYSDTRFLSGITGTPVTQITDLNVRLNISGGYNGDLYAYLTHSSGMVVLLNRVGRNNAGEFGYDNAGFNVTFNDQAGTDIHGYQTVSYSLNLAGQLTGGWQADGRNIDPNDVVTGDNRMAFLSSFNGLDPNGSWTLFLADLTGGDQSTLVSWGLDISVVPEPTTWALIFFLTATLFVRLRSLWRRSHTRQEC